MGWGSMPRSGRSPTIIFPHSSSPADTRFTSSTFEGRARTPIGRCDRVNKRLRQTFLCERGESSWTVDDLVKYDVPAILDYVERETGRDRVNWIGHSLGGMVVFTYLEQAPHNRADRQLRRDGEHDHSGRDPADRHAPGQQGLRLLSLVASPGRLGRPLAFVRIPGMEIIDRFYYSNENVDRITVWRFYGYTLEDTGPGACASLPLISGMATWSRLTARSITRRCWQKSRRPPS